MKPHMFAETGKARALLLLLFGASQAACTAGEQENMEDPAPVTPGVWSERQRLP